MEGAAPLVHHWLITSVATSGHQNPEGTFSATFRRYSWRHADPGPLVFPSLLILSSKLPLEPEMPRGGCGWFENSRNVQPERSREVHSPNNPPFKKSNKCTNGSF